MQTGPTGERHLALHEGDSTSHVVTRLPLAALGVSASQFGRAVQASRQFVHPHVVPIEHFGDEDDTGWLVSPFMGDRHGVVTLGSLLRDKGGFLSPVEARHAVVQLLEAVQQAHAFGACHGSLLLDEIMVDRSGSVFIEHYGLRRMLGVAEASGSLDADQMEVQSVVAIGYQLVTGLVPETPLIAASRVVPGLDPTWDDWVETGLLSPRAGGPGFKSAAHALTAIAPAGRSANVRRGTVSVRMALKSLLVGV
ncbi:MAG: hypothetical protein ACKVS8_07630 [Phycisphaerales bacterium]